MPLLLNLLNLVLLLFWVNSLAIVFSVLNEILRLVFLNNLVINFVCRPTYMNVAHFVFGFVFVFYSSIRSCVFVSFVRVILSKILTSYLLLNNIRFIVSYSFLLFFYTKDMLIDD